MTKMFNFIAVDIVGDGQHAEEEYEFTVSFKKFGTSLLAGIGS